MRETFYDFVRFSKSGSDTTVEPNFDERTVSGIQKLSNNKRRQCAFFCCIKLANLGEGGIDFLDIPELVGWHAYFQILTT